MISNPAKQIYKTTIEYILSDAEIAGLFKPANITRYDAPTTNRYPFKQDLAPADLPDFILQLNGMTQNRRSSCGYLEIYDFQLTITTNGWNMDQAGIGNYLMKWIDRLNYDCGCHLNWGDDRAWFKCEVMPMQIANHNPTNRNLSGFIYLILFNIQVQTPR